MDAGLALTHKQQGYRRMEEDYPFGTSQYDPVSMNAPTRVAPTPPAPTQTAIVRQTQSAQPNDYLTFAIIVTLCCCLPLGIVAIIQATNVRSRFAAGDKTGAEKASRSAKCWSIAGLVTGIVVSLLGIFIIIIYVNFFAVAVTSVQGSIHDLNMDSTFNHNY